MLKYSDFLDRILLQPKLLEKLCPAEPLHWQLPGRLREAAPAAITGEKPIENEAAFGLLRGLLFYAVDDLDAAHRIFQDDAGDLGSYCHGMLHRREPDFDNARYWFRRAGRLSFFARLHEAASEHSPVVGRQPTWDPYLFTGECEQARHGAVEKTPELAKLQRAEFEVLLDYLWRKAVKSGESE